MMYGGNSAEIWILLTKIVPGPGYDEFEFQTTVEFQANV